VPLEEYARAAPAVATVGGAPRVFWNWDEILSKFIVDQSLKNVAPERENFSIKDVLFR